MTRPRSAHARHHVAASLGFGGDPAANHPTGTQDHDILAVECREHPWPAALLPNHVAHHLTVPREDSCDVIVVDVERTNVDIVLLGEVLDDLVLSVVWRGENRRRQSEQNEVASITTHERQMVRAVGPKTGRAGNGSCRWPPQINAAVFPCIGFTSSGNMMMPPSGSSMAGNAALSFPAFSATYFRCSGES